MGAFSWRDSGKGIIFKTLNRNFVSNGKHRSFTFSLFPRSFVEIVVCIRAWEKRQSNAR